MYLSSRLPSVKTIQTRLNLTQEQAKRVRAEMEKCSLSVYYNSMKAIDAILGTHGVEGFHGLYYCNTGDTYGVTVLYIINTKSYGPRSGFAIGNCGDLVKKYPPIFGE